LAAVKNTTTTACQPLVQPVNSETYQASNFDCYYSAHKKAAGLA